MLAVNNAPMQLDNTNWRDLGTDYATGAKIKELYNAKAQEKLLNGILAEKDPAKQLEMAANSKHAAKLLPAVQAHHQTMREAADKNAKAAADLEGVNATTQWTGLRAGKTKAETVGVGIDNAGKVIENKAAAQKMGNDDAEAELKRAKLRAENALMIEERLANAALGAQENPRMFLNQLQDLYDSGQISQSYAQALYNDVTRNGGVNAAAMLKAYSKSTANNFNAQKSQLDKTNLGGQTVFNSYNPADGTLTTLATATNSVDPSKAYATDADERIAADNNATSIINNRNTVQGAIERNRYTTNAGTDNARFKVVADNQSREKIAADKLEQERITAAKPASAGRNNNGAMPSSSVYNKYLDTKEALADVGNTDRIINDLKSLIGSGNLKLGYFSNATNEAAAKYAGSSSPEVLALRNLRTQLDRLKNAALRLNKGTQTDMDYARIEKEIQGYAFPTSVAQALQQVQFLAQNIAAEKAKLNRSIGTIETDYPGLNSARSAQSGQAQYNGIDYSGGNSNAMPPNRAQRQSRPQQPAASKGRATQDLINDFWGGI